MKYRTRVLAFALALLASNCDSKRPDFVKAASQPTNSSSSADSGAGDGGPDDSLGSDSSGVGSTGNGTSAASGATSGAGGSGAQTAGTGAPGTGTTGTGAGTGPNGADATSTKDGGGGGTSPGSDDPGPDETTSTGNGTTTSSPVNPGTQLAALGDACDAASECESGFCADDVCCDTACNEICARCDIEDNQGTCSAAERDEDCGELDCSEDTECRTYELASENNCSEIGECAVEADCDRVNTDNGDPCQDGAGTCNGSGECVVPNKAPLGESCGDDSDCGSGFSRSSGWRE